MMSVEMVLGTPLRSEALLHTTRLPPPLLPLSAFSAILELDKLSYTTLVFSGPA